MASLENLPADQRAVLQLVLQRGRTYDQIAELLSIDRAGVRQRALQAFDELGPHTRVPPERRALITDYLLGQLPSQVSEDTRERLAESPAERAWARVVASELTPLAANRLPEIPVEAARRPDSPSPAGATEPLETSPVRDRADVAETEPPSRRERPPERRAHERPEAGAGRSSRRGGAILLGVAAAAVVALVVVLIVTGGSSSRHSSSTASSAASSTPAAGPSSTTSSTTPQVLSQVNLTSPSAGSKTAGIAAVFKQKGTTGILIRAQNVPANTQHDAYAVWLYNSPTDSHILGFVNPGVGSNGSLSTAGVLPANAGHFKQLLVTLETQRAPTRPGKIILQGALGRTS